MSQISLKSITGITSITTPAGVDNQLTVHTNDTAERIKITSSGLNVSGVVTATSFVGSGANLTSLPAQATIANNADNRVITGGSGVNLNGEANLTWNGTAMAVGHSNPNDTLHVYHATDNLVARFESGDTGGGITLKDNTHVTSLLTTNGAFEINVDVGGDVTGETIAFKMSGSEKARIDSNGGITQTSTKAFQIAKGSTSDRPTGVVGMIRFNTETDRLENYTSSGWQNVNVVVPVISSITGNIYAGMATNLTLAVSDTSATVTVIFKEGGTTKATLTNQSVSSDSLIVAVPSAVYGESAGDTITITITNDDGVVSAGLNKTIQTAPSGGTITTSGNYRIHSFTSSGNFVNTVASLAVEYLIIAGGGAGGAGGSSVAGGGGGAGGYRSNVSGQSSGGGNSAESAMSLSAATFAVVVGDGAPAMPGTSDAGATRGNNSSFNSIVSTGGGGGGGNSSDSSQASGGSGGGGKESDGSGGAGTSGQGYAGGNGSESGNAGGGGGGAGEAGNTDGFPFGGDGVSSNITGSSVTRAGGGSSGNTSGANGAVGGTGGGGQGAMSHTTAGSGTINTGSGGGGGYSISVGASGAGGKGIVILRYNMTTI